MNKLDLIINRYVNFIYISILFIYPVASQTSTASELRDSIETVVPFPEYEDALPIYERIHDLSANEGDLNLHIYAKIYISFFHNHFGNHIIADEYIEEGFSFVKDSTGISPDNSILMYQMMQDVERKRGNLKKANELNQKYIELELKNGSNDVQLGLSYLELAIGLRIFGDFENVILLTNKSFDLFNNSNDSLFTHERDKPLRLFKALQIRGLCYKDLKNYEQAIEDYSTSLSYLKKSIQYTKDEGIKSRIDCFNRMADVYLKKGELSNASNTLRNLSPLFINESYDKFRYYELLAQLSMKNGKFSDAMDEVQKSIKLANIQLKNDKEFPSIARLYMILGDINIAQNSLFEAIEAYHKGLQQIAPSLENDISKNPDISFISEGFQTLQLLEKKADCLRLLYEKTKNKSTLQQCISTYNTAIKLIGKMKADFVNEGSKYRVAEMATAIYQKALESNHTLYQVDKSPSSLQSICTIIEKNKAEILFQNISSKYNLLASDLSEELINKGIDLKYSISYYSKLLSEEELKTDKNEDDIAKLKDKLFKLNESLAFYDQKLKEDYPDFYKFKNEINTQASIEQLQGMLESDQIIIEFFQTEDHIYALSIGKNRIGLRKDSLAKIKALTDTYYNQISNPPSQKSLPLHELNAMSYTLSSLLLINDSNYSPTLKKIILVPDGILNKVPFETLLINESGQMLLEQCVVTYNYSANQYHENQLSEIFKNPTVLSITPTFEGENAEDRSCNSTLLGELPFAKQEAQYLQSNFEGKFFDSDKALSRTLEENFADFPIIHLATHACVNEENPMLSQIHFTNGALTNYDIQNLNARPELVILSACNTASGQLKDGEGLIGLSRGFFEAGVKGMQSSLWSINDKSSSQIVTRMYHYLKLGHDKSEALRLSKLDYLNKADKLRSHPYYWAALIHIGNDHPFEFSQATFQHLSYILLGGLLLMGILYFYKRKKTA